MAIDVDYNAIMPGFISKKSKYENDSIIDTSKTALISRGIHNKHLIFYKLDGSLYGISWNTEYNVLGLNSYKEKLHKFVLLCSKNELMKSRIISIQCGSWHTLCLTMNGNVFACGLNNKYQLSNQFDKNSSVQLCQIKNTLGNITQIGCGNTSSFMMNKNGIIHSFGSNGNGMLGINESYYVVTESGEFNKINGLKFKSFDVTYYHIGCITTDNEVYLWGWNYYGQCGYQDEFSKNALSPRKLIFNDNISSTHDNITDIKCGQFHNFIKNDKNEYYSFGYNRGNCLLIENLQLSTKIYSPTKIDKSYIMKMTKFNGDIIDIIPGSKVTYILIYVK